MSVSIVIPIYNERENIPHLYDGLVAGLVDLRRPFEIILVNDGSTDGSTEALNALAARDPRVKVVHFRRNFGQSAAMDAGIQHASGDVIVTMDGDLQNDPTDIPRLVDKLEEGFDLVHGWRKRRQDTFINRRLPSIMANWLISRVTRFQVHDLGCTLKVMRSEIGKELHLQGEMHRFLTILAHARGARCVEVETKHHARKFGKTKYGISRTIRVVLDLITVKFMLDYLASPMRLFGGIGIGCTALGLASGLVAILMKLGYGFDLTGTPFLMLSAFLCLAGMQFFTLGLLGEVAVRTLYASTKTRQYAVRELVNFDEHTSEKVVRRAA